jgi:hypothetical protein
MTDYSVAVIARSYEAICVRGIGERLLLRLRRRIAMKFQIKSGQNYTENQAAFFRWLLNSLWYSDIVRFFSF